MKFALQALLLSLVASLTSCASSRDTGDLDPYRLTRTQADAVIRDAIREGFPDKEARPLGEGRVGYEFRVWLAVDMDVVRAEALPVGSGRYEFRVTRSGTAPASGRPARDRLLELIAERASVAAL